MLKTSESSSPEGQTGCKAEDESDSYEIILLQGAVSVSQDLEAGLSQPNLSLNIAYTYSFQLIIQYVQHKTDWFNFVYFMRG